MNTESMRRRRFLGVAATAIGVGLAGCSGDDGGNGGSNDDGGSNGDDDGGSNGGGGADQFDGWFDDVDNYDGVEDHTGESEVTVMVGAEGNGGAFAFEPAAITVDTGTTVVWEWTGEGGSHDVSEVDGAFESELVAEAGHTFSHTFDDAGTFKYVCTPHEAMGMKGAVVVE